MSPAARRGTSCSRVASTEAAGTMSQSTRGVSSFATRSGSEVAPPEIAPSFTSASTVSACRAYPSTVWPLRSQRRDMLAPMRPSPTSPSFMAKPLVWSKNAQGGLRHEAGAGGTRAHGRQHVAALAAQRPHRAGIRPACRNRRGAREGRRDLGRSDLASGPGGKARDAAARLDPLFKALAPGAATASRTPGREGDPGTAEQGYLHCGPAGAGHFVKMVHNGIEYGLMAAYAEGLNILHHADAGLNQREIDAETSPLREPELYQYRLDLPAVTEVWRRGSVVASWLLDLTAQALLQSPDLADFSGRVSDSGEGRWTSIAAIDVSAPAPILTTALYERFTSRGEADFGDKVLSAMRFGFGGHLEKRS